MDLQIITHSLSAFNSTYFQKLASQKRLSWLLSRNQAIAGLTVGEHPQIVKWARQVCISD